MTIWLALCASAAAAPLTYQGRALDSVGAPIEGAHDATVRLYAQPTTGEAFHTEPVASVVFTGGYFSVAFDVLNTAALGAPTWVTVEVGGLELAPRQPLGSAPNALTAARLWLGDDASRPASSCRYILEAGASTGSKAYWIDPDGGSPSNAYLAHCDMDTNGGGWTLVHTKVEPTFIPWKATHAPACGASTAASCASAVHPQLVWTQAMWRFSDTAAHRVVYRRSADGRFTDFLRGGSSEGNPTVGGLTRLHPVNGWSEETAVASFHFYGVNYISENRGGSDQWLDLWNGLDTSNAYTSTAGAATLIHGYRVTSVAMVITPKWHRILWPAFCNRNQ